MAKKTLHRESMVVVAVGDHVRIAYELERLELGPVKDVP
jgi:hypothetical protein